MFLFNSKENIPPSFQSGNIREKIPLDPKSFIRVYIQIPDTRPKPKPELPIRCYRIKNRQFS